MLKIGLTGGIGSGKSMIAALLKTMAYPVYDTDFEAKRLCNECDELKNQLSKAFGNDLYKNAVLDKTYFASIIFTHSKHLQEANAIIHPFVTNNFLKWAKNQDSSLAFVESAILFESELLKHVDKVITVTADEALRIKRIILRDKQEPNAIQARMRNQLPESVRLQKADYIIYNDEKQLLIPQVEKILSLL